MAHLYAMFPLAQFREDRAYPLVVRFALLPGDLAYSLCGDSMTQDLGRVLASVCGGELGGIQAAIENKRADERGARRRRQQSRNVCGCGAEEPGGNCRLPCEPVPEQATRLNSWQDREGLTRKAWLIPDYIGFDEVRG
jgi:hypothetical protein